MSNMNVLMHNIQSMFTSRQLGITNNNKAKSTEKLSSGYRINRAADDAAGLTISEKLRTMVRGLNQGTKNISDGVSLVQTTEGALSEVTDVLQRMRELSIKAYNGTNTREDRNAIQAEINQLKDEIFRTAEATTFNDIHVLKGNPYVTERTLVEDAKKVTTETVRKSAGDLSWLEIDKVLERHQNIGVYQGVEQDTKPNMIYRQYYKKDDGSLEIFDEEPYVRVKEYKYWGENKTELNDEGAAWGISDYYGGEWSQTITDNATAKLDFKGLVTKSDTPQKLYENLADLLGTSFGCACGTCEENGTYFGLSYSGEVDGIRAEPQWLMSGSDGMKEYDLGEARLDLPSVTIKQENADGEEENVKIFDAIHLLIKECVENEELTEAEIRDKTADLADKIAKAIVESSIKAMSPEQSPAMNSHYDRVIKGNDDYSMIIYDFRDYNADDPANSALSKPPRSNILLDSHASITISEDIPPHYENIPVKKAIQIVCSGVKDDEIPIELPDLKLELDILHYDVARYNETTVYTYEHFEESEEDYQKRLKKYEKDMKKYEEDMEKYEKEKKEYDEKMRAYNVDLEEYKSSTITTEGTKTVTDKVVFNAWEIIDGELKPTQGVKEVTKEVKTFTTIHTKTEPKKPVEPLNPIKPVKPVKGQGTNQIPHTEYVYDPSSVTDLDDALDKVLHWRSYLGAQQNRLESAYRNNQNKAENTDAAESRIRDTDMAEEISRFTKDGILQQAGQSMLAQANQNRQGLLNLLQ